MSEWRDSRDDAIDEALTGYVEAPDNEGLESRILARVSKRTTRERRIKLSVAAGMAALASGCLLWWRAPGPAIEIKPAIEIALVSKHHGSAGGQSVSSGAVESVAIAPNPRRTRKQRAYPKLPQFPVPYQVGSEERALLELARYTERHAIQQSNYIDNPVKPIELVAVEIKPIK